MKIHSYSPRYPNFFRLLPSYFGAEIVMIFILMLLMQSCTAKESETTPTAGNNGNRTGTIPMPTDVSSGTSPLPTDTLSVITNTPDPTLTPTANVPTSDASESDLIRQGAAFGFLEPYEVDEISVGKYQPEYPECGNGWLATLPEEEGETILTLHYAIPLLVERIEIFAGEMPVSIQRIELLNSNSGVGSILDSNINDSWEPISEGTCSQRLVLPANTDIEVDTVIIAYENLASAAKVATVEMLGSLYAYTEPPVFWRVPLPSTPVDIAMRQNGMVYVATQPNNLFAYDIEGNQLKKFSTPSEAKLTSVEADLFGNLIVADAAYGWFIVLSPTGEQLAAGGNDLHARMSVNPQDGNLYLLSDNTIYVYTTDTAELIRSIPLDELHQNTALAFNSQGELYLLRDYEWDATLIVMDPLTGEELDAIPLDNSEISEIVIRDIAIDETGNIYVLYIVNTGQIAIHKIDPQGALLQRFGSLYGDFEDRLEGSFLDPYAITVSPDGRFVLVADGYEEHSYLTAFLMEIDE
ncbi:MAG: hypothetical protein JW908_10750 [Anaerolineales bacterium]|nr:hypothetical protein [Anaerolineales bacterium]